MQESNEKKSIKRIEYLDIARGIAIILMVIGHVIPAGYTNNLIYSFHMPMFVLISGFFFKKNERIYKLLLYYIIVISIQVIFNYTDSISALDKLRLIYTKILLSINDTPNGISDLSVEAMWFLPFLIVVKLLFKFNTKICGENNKLLFILCFLECTIGYFLSKNKLWLVWHIDVALYSIIWFYLGYILHKKGMLEKIINNNIIIFSSFCIWIIGSQILEVSIASRRYIYTNVYILPILVSVCGIFSVIWISKKIENFSRFLKYCGKNSMYFLASYYLVAIYVSTINSLSITSVILLEILISYLITLIFDKLIVNNLKHFVGFKRNRGIEN